MTMTTPPPAKSDPILEKRWLGIAGIIAFASCAACCALPLLAAAGLGSGALATLSSVLRPGSEILVGGAVFVVSLAAIVVHKRRHRVDRGCGPACRADGACCDPAR